jgi:hypothetical protein
MSTLGTVAFFEGRPEELALFKVLDRQVRKRWPRAEVLVQKTQIGYADPRPFLWVWLPPRRIKGRPEHYLVVTFGSTVPIESPRIVEKTRIRDQRWTHHVLVAKEHDIDRQLIAWIETSHIMSNPTRA